MAVNIITKFVLQQFAKRSAKKTGIATLKKASDSIIKSNVRNIEIVLKNMGVDLKTLKSIDDVLKHMNYHKAMVDQQLKKQFQKLDLGEGWTGIKGLEKKPTKNPFQGFTPKVIKGGKPKEGIGTLFKDSPEAIAKIKAENKAAAKRLREKKYKDLVKAEEDKMAKDPDYIPDIIDPEDFASGGIAREGFAGGKKPKESWRKKLTRWAGGPDMLAGELGLEGLNQLYSILGMGGLYASGGVAGRPATGLNYLLGEDDQNVRMPYEKGKKVKKGMSRRGFMKLIGGLASLPVLGKYFKLAKVAKPAASTIIKSNAAGMPAWFPSLVKRVLKEGEDITSKAATVERQTVHKIKLPESGTPVEVTQDLVSGNTVVDIGEQTKHGWPAGGRYDQPVRLELKKGEWIEPDVTKAGKVKGKGKKTKDEFIVEEAEFTGGHPENVKFEESVQFKYGDHGSDFSEIEQFATKSPVTSGKSSGEVSRALRREGWYGKKEKARQLAMDKKHGGLRSTYKKDPHVRGKQADKDAWAEGHQEAQWDAMKDEGLDEFSSGGRVSYTKGGLATMLGE